MSIGFANAVCGVALGSFPKSAEAMRRDLVQRTAADLVTHERRHEVCILDDVIGKMFPDIADLLCAKATRGLSDAVAEADLEALDEYIARVALQEASKRSRRDTLATAEACRAFFEEMRAGFKPVAPPDRAELVVNALIAELDATGKEAVPATKVVERLKPLSRGIVMHELYTLRDLNMVAQYGQRGGSTWAVL